MILIFATYDLDLLAMILIFFIGDLYYVILILIFTIVDLWSWSMIFDQIVHIHSATHFSFYPRMENSIHFVQKTILEVQ